MAKSYAPRMHSAEHILNQVMVRTFDCDRCFSAHINTKKSKCDYYFDRDLTQEEVVTLEQAVNGVIDAGLSVWAEQVSIDFARQHFSLTRLPEGVGEVRIVHIGDFDACPCIGNHVEKSNEIGAFTLISHSFADGVLRLRYKLGEVE